jgi:hypothetical protein
MSISGNRLVNRCYMLDIYSTRIEYVLYVADLIQGELKTWPIMSETS